MLQPDTTVLLLIDTSAPRLPDVPPQVFPAARRLLQAASLASVPLLVAKYPKSPTPNALATVWGADPSAVALPFDPTPTGWPTSQLGSRLANGARNQVVILGVWLEEALTLLALNCLSVGYDTYIPIDTTVAAEAAHESAAWQRLTQAGAVPTSSPQVIREWAALCRDDTVQRALVELLSIRSSP